MYDVFILSLIIIAVIGALVCSYKLRDAEIHAVGIVRDTRDHPSNNRLWQQDDESQFDLDVPRTKETSVFAGLRRISEKELSRCESCKITYVGNKDLICQSCGLPLTPLVKGEDPDRQSDASVEKSLSLQDQRFQALEARVRKLEVDSADRSLEETREERPQQIAGFVH